MVDAYSSLDADQIFTFDSSVVRLILQQNNKDIITNNKTRRYHYQS